MLLSGLCTVCSRGGGWVRHQKKGRGEGHTVSALTPFQIAPMQLGFFLSLLEVSHRLWQDASKSYVMSAKGKTSEMFLSSLQ